VTSARSEQSTGDRPSITERLLFAVPMALVYGILLYCLIWLPREPTLPFIAGLVFLPMAIASVVTILIDPRGEGSIRRHIRIGWICITALILLTMVLFREAGICVAMASPFFYGGSAFGSWLSCLSLRKLRSRSVVSCIAILPLAGFPVDAIAPAPQHEAEVRTVVDIDAPPAAVWKNTVEIPQIRAAERRWTFSHNIVGVPQPVDARLQGQGVGAVRHLRWTRGVTFEEVVTNWQENRSLTWRFRFGPQSIPDSVEGHIKIDSAYLKLLGGDYRLAPLAGGRTRLTLTTRYMIATPINAYCDAWGHVFLTDFHRAVLTVIKQRSEATSLTLQSRLQTPSTHPSA
jgi:hypothetical protein